MHRRPSARWVTILVAVAATLVHAPPGAAASGVALAYVDTSLHSLKVVEPGATTRSDTLVRVYTGGILGDAFLIDPAWSPDGRSIAYSHTTRNAVVVLTAALHVVSVDAPHRDRVVVSLPGAGMVYDPAWSPDGRRIAFVLFTPNYPAALATWTTIGSRYDLYVVDADGSDLRPIAPAHPSFVSTPSWSPDGESLAFMSDAHGTPAVFTIPVDGAPVATRVSPLDHLADAPAWSPDGRSIAFRATPVTEPLGLPEVWLADASAGLGSARRVGRNALPDGGPTWSPDSRHLAYPGRHGLVVAAAQRRHPPAQVTVGVDLWPAWSGGDVLAFARRDRTQREHRCGLYTMRLGEPERMVLKDCEVMGPITWSP
jgi:dipeptidyl aminopeptidase/acylaminoacyl peptidase